jgi:sugar porter (SP) family MFS transporter
MTTTTPASRPTAAPPPVSSSRHSASRVVTRAAAITAIGGVLFGYDTGVISGVLPNIATRFDFSSPFMKGLVVSCLLAGAAVGAVAAGRLADTVGRRRLVVATSVTFIVGLLVSITAQQLWWLIVGRVIVGVGVGSASFAVPLYIAEIAPSARRGALVSLNQLSITAGILVSELVAYFLAGSGDWRISVGLALIPAALLGIGMLTLTESPSYLVHRGDEDGARAVLRTAREPGDDIDAEIEEIRQVSAVEAQSTTRDLLSPALRPALVVGVGLAILQQVTGINTVIYYAPTVLEQAGLGTHTALLATVVVGLVNVLLTVAAIRLVDRVGRRVLLLGGSAGMAVGGATLSAVFAIGGDHLSQGAALCTVGALCVFVGSFAIGLGPIFWLLISEIFPLRVRGQASSVATMVNWTANLVVAASYLSILSAIGRPATFAIIAALSLVTVGFTAWKVPETRGRSLSEIEADLGGSSRRQAA